VRRGYIPLSAFAIGAMSPDFEYLWRMKTEWKWSHTPVGVLSYCLPVSLLVLALWVGVAREPVRGLLALPSAKVSPSVRWWSLSVVAILMGAATHVVWDGFTHGFGWAVQLAPVLRSKVSGGVGPDMAFYNVLQHVSTAVGGLVVLAWLWRELRSGTPRSLGAPWRIAVLSSVGILMIILAVWNAGRVGAATDYWSLQIQVGRAAIGALVGLAAGLFVYAVAFRLVRARAP